MKRILSACALVLALAGCQTPAVAQTIIGYCDSSGRNCVRVSPSTPLPVNAAVSATVTGFTATATGTPITATTTSGTANLPAGAVVVAFNKGTSNAAYCKLGAASSLDDVAIPPSSWFSFTVGASTQMTCITSASTTTVNLVGGSGLPAGAGGGGGGGGSGGNVTMVAGAVESGAYLTGAIVDLGAQADAACAADNNSCSLIALTKRNNQRLTTINTTLGSPLQAGGTVGISSLPALAPGTNIIGRVGIDQSTPGTTNLVQIGGTLPAFGSTPTVNLGTIGGVSTAANQTSVIGTKNAGTAAASSQLVGGVYNSSPLSLTNGQQSSLQLNDSGFLNVNIAAGGGAGGTSSNYGDPFPTAGTAIGMSQGGNMVAFTGTSNNLNVAVPAGADVSLGAPTDSACATDNGSCALIPLIKRNNQLVTAGTITAGTAGTPASAVLSIQGISSMMPVATNQTQVNGATMLAGNGATGTGSPRVTIADDTTPVKTRGGYSAGQLSHQVLSFSSSGNNTAITRTSGTIKVYGLSVSCASAVATMTPQDGTSTSLGASSNINSVFYPISTEPYFTTTSTNNFVINLSSGIACTGWAKYLDN